MSIRFFCPLGHRLKVPNDRAGKKGRCPVCRQRLIVPEQASLDRAAGDAPEVLSPDAALSEMQVDDQPVWDDAPVAQAIDAIEPAAAPLAPPPIKASPPPSPPPPPVGITTAEIVAAPPPLPPATAPNWAKGDRSLADSRPTGQDLSWRKVRWATWAQADKLEAFAVCRADPRQLEITYWLACLLPFAAVFCAAPALPYLQFAAAPGWAQAMLCAAAMQLAYSAWLAMMPDWSTVRVGMFLFAVSAAAQLLGMAVLVFAPEPRLAAFGLAATRWAAAAWCGLSLLIASLAGAACRWVAERWPYSSSSGE